MRSDAHRPVVVLYNDIEGGMAHYAQGLAGGLSFHVETRLVAIGRNDEVSSWGWLGRCLRLVYYGRKFLENYEGSRWRRIARKMVELHNPAVVHISGRTPCMDVLVREFVRYNVPVVLTVHDPRSHEESKTLWGSVYERLWERRATLRAASSCAALHVHSDSHIGTLRERWPELSRKRTYVVQHGVGLPEAILNGTSVPSELPETMLRSQTLLFFGRIEPYKGLEVLFAAVEQVVRKHPNLNLIVAGVGRVPEIPASLANRIVLINRFIKDEEIGALFRRSQFVVLPYLSATQTGVVPLAACFAVCAIVSRVGAMAEIVTDSITGIVVTPGCAEQLANAISCFLDRPEEAEVYGKQAQRLALETCSWEKVARGHCVEYENLGVSLSRIRRDTVNEVSTL